MLLRSIVLLSILMVGPLSAVAAAPAGPTLTEALDQIAGSSGIRFRIAPELSGDRIAAPVRRDSWAETVREALRGYNYLGTWDGRGRLVAVAVTGRNGAAGDGAEVPEPSGAAPLAYRRPLGPLPPRYRGYRPGSVSAIDIPAERLRRMKIGERVTADLPDGRYELIHDRVWRHANGDLTWVGRLAGVEGLRRAVLTLGEAGVHGSIRTPGGEYRVESEGAGDWLVDVPGSGLQPGSLEHDLLVPAGVRSGASLPPAAAAVSRVAGKETAVPVRRATVTADGTALVDLLIFYTPGLASKMVMTHMNSLVAFANQALEDSRAMVRFRLAAAQVIDYQNGGKNGRALNLITDFKQPFQRVPRLRNRFGADVVVLVRPFQPGSQGGCGIAWINGGDGVPLDSDLAFAVVSFGASGGYYCSDYTLAHEVGHVLGATHDRQHAFGEGRFPYSYGYGKPGRFGDIMSYYDPEIGLFANPNLKLCDGGPCGVPAGQPNAADVVRTFNNTGATVSGFRRSILK